MSDDGAGIRIIGELSAIRWPDGVSVIEIGTAPFICLDKISQSRYLIAVDAITAGKKPGTVYRIDNRIGDRIDDGVDNNVKTVKETFVLNQLKLTDFSFRNSHAFSLPEIVTLARGLTGLPEKLIVFGVEPENISPGTDLSRTVIEAILKIKEQILIESDRLINEFNHNQ